MESDSIRALLFDVGQVIVRVAPLRTARPLSIYGGSPASILKAFREDPLACRFQEGKISPREWHQHVCRTLSVAPSYARFCAIWNASLCARPLLPLRLFSRLQRRYRLILISNTDPIHAEYIRRHFRFLRHFPCQVLSFEVGARKPSTKIYRAAIDCAEVRPSQIFYVDDIPEFVAAGAKLGMQVHQFQTASALSRDLRARGIL